MMPRIRSTRAPAAVLVLAVFAAWLAGSWLHHHAEAPCGVCKLLQSDHHALPTDPPTAAPSTTASPLVAAAAQFHAESPATLSRGRAPPAV